MAEEISVPTEPRPQPAWLNYVVAGALCLIAGFVLGGIFIGPSKKDMTAAREATAAYTDSLATARVAADTLRAEVTIVAAERDSFKVWYSEAVEMLSQGQAAAAPPTATAGSVTEDWESLGR